MNDYFTFFYVKHFELPMCMKCAIQINLPCLAVPLVSMIMVSSMSQTTERFNLCSANDFLAQTSWLSSPDVDSFRLIGLLSMHLIMLVRLEPREVPVTN